MARESVKLGVVSKSSLVDSYSTPGERVRSAIASTGLRKDAVAQRAHLAPSELSHLMAGRRRLTRAVAERLAPVLGVTADQLLQADGAPSPRAPESDAGRGASCTSDTAPGKGADE